MLITGTENYSARLDSMRAARATLAREIADAIRASDLTRFRTLEQEAFKDPDVFRLLASRVEGANPAAHFRKNFLDSWLTFGDGYRNAINNDLTLLKLLRVVLPRYAGPAVRVYRGEMRHNRRRRTYGMSWTSSLTVAEQFADYHSRHCTDGSVVLSAIASPEAIICKPPARGYYCGEREFIVDRRCLGNVTVLRCYPHEQNSSDAHGAGGSQTGQQSHRSWGLREVDRSGA